MVVFGARVILTYPNGRFHAETLTTRTALRVGSSFFLYGHTWEVVGMTSPFRESLFDDAPASLICEIAEQHRAA
jgi:hypothetical protein